MFFVLSVSGETFDSKSDPQWHPQHSNEAYSLIGSHQSFLKLQKRDAFPATYTVQHDASRFQAGYGKRDETNPFSEFLEIQLSPTAITISRDAHITLPIYYATLGNRLIVSNQYEYIADSLSRVTPNETFMVQTLLLRNSYEVTPLQEVHKLRERESLEFSYQGLRLMQPPSRNWYYSQDVTETDPYQFQSIFEQTMEQCYETCLRGQSYAYEVSGGLDSSVLPIFLTTQYKHETPYLVTMLSANNESKQLQRDQLTALQTFTNLHLLYTNPDPANDFPMAEQIRSKRFSPFETTDAQTNMSSIKKHIDTLRYHDVKVLATGSGGDDIFEHIVAEYSPVEQIPPYVMPTLLQAQKNILSAKSFFLSLFPESMQTQNVTNNLYIEAGIWPVSPFMNYNFYLYAQGLPAYLKHNKNILRAYFQARQFPGILFNSEKGDSILPTLNQFFQSTTFTELAVRFIPSGIYAQLKYIDVTKFMECLARQQQSSSADQTLFQMYQVIATEISLQSTRGLQT